MSAFIKTALLQGQGKPSTHQRDSLPKRFDESHLGTKPDQSEIHPQEIYCLQHCPTSTNHGNLYATIKEEKICCFGILNSYVCLMHICNNFLLMFTCNQSILCCYFISNILKQNMCINYLKHSQTVLLCTHTFI